MSESNFLTGLDPRKQTENPPAAASEELRHHRRTISHSANKRNPKKPLAPTREWRARDTEAPHEKTHSAADTGPSRDHCRLPHLGPHAAHPGRSTKLASEMRRVHLPTTSDHAETHPENRGETDEIRIETERTKEKPPQETLSKRRSRQ